MLSSLLNFTAAQIEGPPGFELANQKAKQFLTVMNICSLFTDTEQDYKNQELLF